MINGYEGCFLCKMIEGHEKNNIFYRYFGREFD